jgi:hypothetical protein
VEVSRARIESDRSRLLTAVFVVLTGFAVLIAAFSLLGPSFFEPLTRTPVVIRLSILLLSIGFIALVREKDRTLREAEEQLTQQEILISSFRGRLQALDALLDACNRVSTPVSEDGVMDVIAETAIELADAENARVDVWEAGADITVERTRIPLKPRWDKKGHLFTLFLPLMSEGRRLGELKIILKEGRTDLDPIRYEAVTRFAREAGNALEKARMMARQEATATHLAAELAVRRGETEEPAPEPEEVIAESSSATSSDTNVATTARRRTGRPR